MVKIGQTKESLTKHHCHGAFIPEVLIYKIMLMLPASSLGRFCCVSKSWLSITTSPSFITAHVQHKCFNHQTLMIEAVHYTKHHSKPRLFLPSFDVDINARINLRELPQLKILKCSKFLNSCDGLMLAWIPKKKQHYVINPLTGRFCILPQSRFETFIGFYFHRPTSEYRLLADWNSEITYVLVIGKTKWRRICDRLPALLFDSNSVEVNESLYWLAWKFPQDGTFLLNAPPNILMTFDKETEIYNLLPLPPSEEFNDRGGGSLINFNGELGFLLISDNGIIDFWIMKRCWIKRYSIYHPDLKECSRNSRYEWNEGFAVSIKDEELFIGVIRHGLRHFLVHWNLKTGACFVQNLNDYSTQLYIRFPYIEALTFFDHSFKSLLSCSHS